MHEDVKKLIAEAEELIKEDEQYLSEMEEQEQDQALLKNFFGK